MKYIPILVDNSIISAARKEAKARMSFGFRNDDQGFGYKYNMLLIASIGELVFQRFLKDYAIPFSHLNTDLRGRVLLINGNKVEIRTSGYEDDFIRLNLLYSKNQYQETVGIDYVVQIFINGYIFKEKTLYEENCNLAYIAGYIEFEKIPCYQDRNDLRRPGFVVPLDYLKSIIDLTKGASL